MAAKPKDENEKNALPQLLRGETKLAKI